MTSTTERRRLVGVDALRGALLAAMVLTPVTGEGGSYPLLGHAAWDGFTVADAIFPAFLVTSGASLALLLRPPVTGATRLRLVRRTLALFVLGALYNAVGGPLDLTELRLTGVLQLIGLSGALAAVLVLLSRRLTRSLMLVAGIALVIPLLYGLSLARGRCTPAPQCNPWFGLDRAVLGREHLYQGGQAGYDPEGLAIVVAATSLVLFGFVAMSLLHRDGIGLRPLVIVAIAGAALIAAGVGLDVAQPINKRLHTPAFVFLAGGFAVLGLAVATSAWDAGRRADRVITTVRRITADPLVTLGRNALVVYLAERLLLVSFANTTIASRTGPVSLQQWVQDWLPVDGLRVHLAYTALMLSVILAITYVMRMLRWRIAL